MWVRPWIARYRRGRSVPKGGTAKAVPRGEWPYLWLDATCLRRREGGRIVSVAATIAVAVDAGGRREIVGLHIGPSEAEAFWATSLKSLVRRGPRGVDLVISDAPSIGSADRRFADGSRGR